MAEGKVDDSIMEATTAEPAADLPDYLTNPNAVLNDNGIEWRYGKPPDYSKTRKEWEKTKQRTHVAGSLPQLVENLVKNWEVEASFKPRLQDWRTIDHQKYSFAMNGGPPQSAEHMLKVGTYNAIIRPNEYYSPEHSDFAASHKTFKRMMPTFAWEVLEVYSGPPTVAFKWRHWGEMKNDYVAFNDKGERVTAKAHDGSIEIFGVTVADVDDKVRLQAINTWMDPLAMFRQIAPYGVVNKATASQKMQTAGGGTGHKANDKHSPTPEASSKALPESHSTPSATGHLDQASVEDLRAIKACPFLSPSGADIDIALVDRDEHRKVPPSVSAAQSGGSEREDFDPTSASVAISKPQASCSVAREEHRNLGNHSERGSLEEESADTQTTQSRATEEHDEDEAPETKRAKLNGNVDTNAVHDAQQALGNASDPMNKDQESSHMIPRSIYSSSITGDLENVLSHVAPEGSLDSTLAIGKDSETDEGPLSSNSETGSHATAIEEVVMPDVGEAVISPSDSQETRITHEEMSTITPAEQDTLMNQE